MFEPIFDLFEPRERITVFSPLGIRFWDPARDTQVRDGLTVIACPQGSRHAATRAFRTLSGIYAFHGLPGLHDIEYPAQDSVPTTSPPEIMRFIVQVIDEQRRFLPVVFGVDLPYQGIFPTGTPSSPPGNSLPGFYLFSAPTRPRTPSLAVVRAQLEERVDAVTRQPAGHAVLEVEAPGQETWYGVADERGSVVVMFPYPTFTGTNGVSSPVTSPAGVVQQHWDLSIRIRYEPAALTFPNGFQIPDLRSIFNQAPGVLWSTLTTQPGQPVSQLSAELIFGQELVMRTDGGPTLLIGSTSPP